MKLVKRKSPLNHQNIIIFLFVVVSLLVSFFPYLKLDLQITEKIQSINSIFFTQAMWFISSIGNQPIMPLIVCFTCLFLYLFKLRLEATLCLLSTAGSVLSGSLIKMLINRPRPGSNLVHVFMRFSDKSYPSNHVLVFTVFFGFLLYLLLKSPKRNIKGSFVSIIFFLFIASIGISRIYLGAHWATDVLGGYLLGIIWLIFTIKLYNSYNGKR